MRITRREPCTPHSGSRKGEAVCGEAAVRERSQSPSSGWREHGRSRRPIDQDGRCAYRVHTIGHSTSLASRLQTLANPGSIAISEAVRKLIQSCFALKIAGTGADQRRERANQRLRGDRTGPLRTRLQRSAGRGLTKFVGREREMEALSARPSRPGRGTDRSWRRSRSRASASLGCTSNQGNVAIGVDGAGDVFGLARQSFQTSRFPLSIRLPGRA
jgi:hypothetical protein